LYFRLSFTCLKKPVFSKGDLLQRKVGTSQPVTISKKWKNPSSALRRRRRNCTYSQVCCYVDWIFRGENTSHFPNKKGQTLGASWDFQTFFFVHLEACGWLGWSLEMTLYRCCVGLLDSHLPRVYPLDLVLVQQVAIQCVTDSCADATLEPGLG
jgi:hypothetical protein